MISVEKFGEGALRVSYDDGRDDWMFWPFEEGADCEQAFVTGETTFWVYRRTGMQGIEAATFDAGQRVRVHHKQFAAVSWFVNAKGEYLTLHRLDNSAGNVDGTNHIAILRARDLSEAARIEDSRLERASFLCERYDGAIVAGTLVGPSQAVWIVTFDGGEPRVEEVDGAIMPHGLSGLGGYGDPTGRWVVTVGAESTPIEQMGGQALYGIPVEIWDLERFQIEKTVIVDRVPIEFSSEFAGQDRLKPGNAWREKWDRVVAAVDPASWDGAQITFGTEGAPGTPYNDLINKRRDFVTGFIRNIAWDPDGGAFWVLFGAGFLRRVSIDGSVSPRYVVQRMATPPVMGKRRWLSGKYWNRQEPTSLRYLPNGQLRIMSRHPTAMMDIREMVKHLDDGGAFQFDPTKFSLKGGLLHRLVSPFLGPRIDGIYVSSWRDGFVSKSISEFQLILDGSDGRKAGKSARLNRAIEARKAKFLKQTSQSQKQTTPRPQKPKKAAGTAEAEPPVEEPDPKPLPEPGKIEVEKFGYDISGALRVVYGDGGEDWMFLPFREDDLKEFHILGDDRILAVSSRELKLYDAKSRTCAGRRQVGYNTRLQVASSGEWLSVIGQIEGEKHALTILGGRDLGEMLLIEDESFNHARPVYERHDGAVIAGGFVEGPVHVTYVVTFEDGKARAERRHGKPVPGSFQNNYICPSRKRVVCVHANHIPIVRDGDANAYGIPVEIWDLDRIEIERQIVADYLPRRLQLNDKFDPPDWDGSLKADPSLGVEEAKRLTAILGQALSFLRDEVRGVAWQPDGEAFWVMFAAGFLRRVSLDGSVSPRCIVERIWSPSPQASVRHLGFGIEMRPDGRLRIDCMDQSNSKSGFVYVRPEMVEARAAAGGPDQDIWIRKKEDGYELKPPFKYRSDDEALEARKKAFCERAMESPVPLADLSGPSCIAAIEALTEAIARDPFELVCGYRFRPTFVLAEGTPDERRMGEDVFFAHVAANAPEARSAIERLLHTWMDKVPLSAKHRNYYMNDQTVALSHALKALITLDPCCYDTIRRYVTETDFEHDVIVKGEILPYFGRVNGWRDPDAIKLGIFCMLEEWCAGSGGSWIDPTMQQKIEQTMAGREFAEFFMYEVGLYFLPPESSVNREAWTGSNARSYLEECEMMNFRRPEGFDREVMAVIAEYLKPEPD